MDPISIQKQIRDNSQDFQNFLLDLKNWENDMKRKDRELLDSSKQNYDVPPVRNKIKKVSEPKKVVCNTNSKEKRISSYDYASWDKFDVDKACADVEETVKVEEQDSEEEMDKNQDQNKDQALYEKELGNQYVKVQEWKEAIKCYTRAIELYTYEATFYANRALCYLKTNSYKLAEIDCTTAIQLDKTYVKAYQRRALAKVGIGQIKEAKVDFQKVLELEPNNAAAKSELLKLENKNKPQVKSRPEFPKETIKKEKHFQKQIATKNIDKKIEGNMKQNVPLEIQQSKNICTNSAAEDIIIPIQKPPHLRSKKPLRSVVIEEVENEEEFMKKWSTCISEHNISHLRDHDKSDKPTIEELDHTTYTTQIQKQRLETTAETHCPQTTEVCQSRVDKFSVSDENKCKSQVQKMHKTLGGSGDNIVELPPPPKTSIQFLLSWKLLQNNSELRYQFLKQIPSDVLRAIFQDSLESREFSEIISTLILEFVKRNEPVHEYLMGLSEVKRFSALVMFMTKTEKLEIKKLLEYSVKRFACSKEIIEELSRRYEI